jgi:hypothetical protein
LYDELATILNNFMVLLAFILGGLLVPIFTKNMKTSFLILQDRSLVSGSIWMDEFLGGRGRREELATPQKWRRGDKEEEMVIAACVAVAGSQPGDIVGRLPAITSPSSCCPTSCCRELSLLHLILAKKIVSFSLLNWMCAYCIGRR